MTDLKYEYGSCLPSNFHIGVLSGRDSPHLRSDSSSPSTVTSPNRCSWGSDGEKATSSSDGEKTRSSPDEHFSSHESSCENALGASVRSDDADGGLLCYSMESYSGLDRDLYPESGRAQTQWAVTSLESHMNGAGSLETDAEQLNARQSDVVSMTPEILLPLHSIHVSNNVVTDRDLQTIAADNNRGAHANLYSTSNDTSSQGAPLVNVESNVSNSKMGSESTPYQPVPKLDIQFPTRAPLFPSLPKPESPSVPYLPTAHNEPTYQSTQNVPTVQEANKRIQEVAYPHLFQKAYPPPIKEPEIKYSSRMPTSSYNKSDPVSDSNYQEFAIRNRAYSRILNNNLNPDRECEINFTPKTITGPEVRHPCIPPLNSNLAAPPFGQTSQRAASISSHFKFNYPPLDVSLPPPRYNNPNANFTRPKTTQNQPPKRAVVGRPPVSLPGDPAALPCSDKNLSETIGFTQLLVSWDSLCEINTYNGAFELIEQFNDCVKVYEESSALEGMGSYVRRVVNVKEDREARKLPEHEKQEKLKEAIKKLNDEQAFLTDFLANYEAEEKNAAWTSPLSNKKTAPTFNISLGVSEKEKLQKSLSLLHFLDQSQQEETTVQDHFKNVPLSASNEEFLETCVIDNQFIKRFSKEEEKHIRSPRTGSHMCTFCRQNGETEEFYSSHELKDAKGKIICPTLRSFVCPFCGATGANAHTASYCPQNPDSVRIKHSPHKKNKEGFTRYSHGLKYTG